MTALDQAIRAAEANAIGNSDCIQILGACAELRAEFIALTVERDNWKKWHEAARQGGERIAAERDALAAELTRLRRICNAMPTAAADGPGISIDEAQEYV